jgi:5-methylcytosine-specific restriction endonuclease McrA
MSVDIFKSQTAMLQWLRRRGGKVDFSHDRPIVEQCSGVMLIQQLDIYWAPIPPGSPLYRYNGSNCPYCEESMVIGTRKHPTRDHVRPRRASGTLAPHNSLVVCAPCNVDKSDMMLREFVVWLEKRNDRRADIVRKIDPDYGLVKDGTCWHATTSPNTSLTTTVGVS